jgi:hypothetical protein
MEERRKIMPKLFRDVARRFVDAQTEEDRMKIFDEIGDGELYTKDEQNDTISKLSEVEKQLTVTQARYDELNSRYKDIIFGGGANTLKDDEDEKTTKPQVKTLEDLGF